VTDAEELLAVAEHLVEPDAAEPNQASLRRAISTAYYALFHFLGEAASCLVPTEPPGLVTAFRRTLDHKAMKAACEALMNRQDATVRSLIQQPLEDDLQQVSEAFKSLQEARHIADYNMLHTWTREETLILIDLARKAMAVWPGVMGRPNTNVFLMMLSRPINLRRA
jgi:hypothetical protein